MTKPLSQYINLNRRYSRSINLERDINQLEALEGYIPTNRSITTLRRILSGIASQGSNRVGGMALALQSSGNRAWTLTSVYGTGKSAFAHYLTALLADNNSKLRIKGLEIAKNTLGEDSPDYQTLTQVIPEKGYICAVVTGQREPISHTIIRALSRGVETYWKPAQRNKIPAIAKLTDLETELVSEKAIDSRKIVEIVQELATASKTGIFLIIDELGKSLEYAAYNQGAEDLYLLQQLAELPQDTSTPVYLLGILHQAFAEYSQRLASVQRNEWAKIQGRFEDIPFTESASSLMRLMGQAIDKIQGESFQCAIHNTADEWFSRLKTAIQGEEITLDILEDIYPLHPVSALALPTLCQRYAQNDRSLFTFLTSNEPYSFRNFLDETTLEGEPFPTLKLDRVYDYFIEAAGMGLASRPNLQRWVEIQDLIADAKRLENDSLRVLKAIGILNLITTTGANRATRELVTLAMCDSPNNTEQLEYWGSIIDDLLQKNIITHRRQLDELRIWQGSDFNVDSELNVFIDQQRDSLVNLLSSLRPLNPQIAQRHSYKTGTLRYFERRYLDTKNYLNPNSKGLVTKGEEEKFRVLQEQLQLENADSDGLIGYWLDEEIPTQISSTTVDGKPFILICAAKLDLLRIRTREYAALKQIQTSAPELQTDGVARREVRYRVAEAERLLDETLAQAFDLALNDNPCWVQGEEKKLNSVADFNATLSHVCDEVYHKTPILWNELINRRDLTSQGTKARRELITAMTEQSEQPRLGLSGYGPEVSMYYSLLEETRIHRQTAEIIEKAKRTLPLLQTQENVDSRGNATNLEITNARNEEQIDNPDISATIEEDWDFYPPEQTSGIFPFWKAVEDFCLNAYDTPHSLDKLYKKLAEPPYGIKQGAIPVLIAAVILYHLDDVGLYQDGTFIAILGAEHFELLVKDPSRFAIKYFEVVGLRSEVFKELESILRNPNLKKAGKLRNATLLTVVTPLYQFVKKLPAYTKQTQRLSEEALGVLKALQTTVEPDELIFTSLPVACNLDPIGTEDAEDGTIAKTLRTRLVQALREINTAYETLLTDCQGLLYEAFGVRSQEKQLREDLRVRANYLAGQCVERNLRSFVQAAIDEDKSDPEWLEAVVMVISDKPPESWTDKDVTGFEVKLSDIARRFKNLEALQKEVAAKGDGFEARRITVTRPDGEETHRMVWVDNSNEDKVEEYVNKILSILPDNEQIRQAVLAKLTERVLNADSGEGIVKLKGKRTPKSQKIIEL
ncbi:MAG: hypothetical protein AAGF26_09300 [Cyanobacteria bacterium P01_G01_bin.49]